MSFSSKEYFDQIGSEWDQMQQRFFSIAVRETALSVAGAKVGEIAADIGAGTGFITEGLLESGLTVVAVDQSEAMLAALRAKFPSNDVECRVGTAEALPLENESMDHVFANMYLHHVDDPPNAVTEMARTLKPGGKLVITDLDSHDFEFLKTAQHDRWMGFERPDVERWFLEAGLMDVKVDCVGQSCCTTSDEGKDVAISIFVASGKRPERALSSPVSGSPSN
jgi:ubiquinone/menaquinone biosynthesis C-methylase UbiE